MRKSDDLKFDEIGNWSEIKLDIIREYATKYSTILASQSNLTHIYIDAFAGSGIHISKKTGDFVKGSPLNALLINPPFSQYYLIDIDKQRIDFLKENIGDRSDVHIYEGDCNEILLTQVFPKVKYKDYRRGLCILDPYGLHLDWKVIRTAGQMNSIDIFINFPVMDINRNALWREPERVPSNGIHRMNIFWGDESWRSIAYSTTSNFFGFPEKEDNATIVKAFRKRLQEVAGFKIVPKAHPMYNSRGAVIYYLIFASQKPVALNIINHIFKKYSKFE
ncbi:MAG: three-Cys-motif partner protein TcmP [bacterium]